MAGNKRNHPKGILVCDLCYKRKVKCDRKDPCKNCVAASSTCQWTRQVRERRRKPKTSDAVRMLEDRVHHLENLLQQSDKSERVIQTDHDDGLGADYDGDMEEDSPGDNHHEDILQASNNPPEPLPLVDALERVREAVKIFSSFTTRGPNMENESLTSTDILNAMTRPSSDPADVIPPSSVNKMGLALMSNDSSHLRRERKATYKSIIAFKAALALGQQTKPIAHTVTHHIKRIQTRAFDAALISNSHLREHSEWCLINSFLSLLQTYCVQAIVSQFFGHVWQMRCTLDEVSRASVKLTYPLPKTPDTEAVEKCLKWCYRADMFMSVFLRQSRHMSRRLEGGEGDLGIYKGLLYRLQDELLNLESLTIDMTEQARRIEELDHDVKLHPDMQDDDTRLDFRLYATLTVLWHNHPDLGSKPQIQTKLTDYARETLKLLNQLDCRLGLISCEADITLHWDILCSGVLPMLILCVHTLRFNDPGAFGLLKGYSGIVSDLSSNYNKNNALATQVNDLCVALVAICKACHDRVPQNIPNKNNHTPFRKNFLNFDSFFVPANHQDDDDYDNENPDALVAEILTLQPKIYKPISRI